MEWIRQALASAQAGPAALAAAALLGVVMAVGSCCNLPVVLAVAGYAGSRDGGGRGGLRTVGTGFFLGVMAAMAGLSLLIASAGRLLGSLQGDVGRLVAGFLFLLFGLWALGWLPFRLPKFASKAGVAPSDLAGAALFGFAAGGATVLCSLACAAPLVPVMAGLTAAQGTFWRSAAVLLMVALGYAASLTALLLGVSLGRAASFMQKLEKGIRLISGLALLAAGFWLLAKG